jgi:hypothetical protein
MTPERKAFQLFLTPRIGEKFKKYTNSKICLAAMKVNMFINCIALLNKVYVSRRERRDGRGISRRGEGLLPPTSSLEA